MKILGTGLSGMVGSRVVELLGGVHEFKNLSLETNVDITQKEMVFKHVGDSNASWVFHFAARTDVENAELESGNTQGSYWNTNVCATQYFVEACKKYSKKLLYLSTDYVFDGKKAFYDEKDTPHPLGWYAKTKYEGEMLVSQLEEQALIIRIANPYCELPQFKPDFVHRIAKLLSSGKSLSAPTDQIFIPTFIDDIAVTIEKLMMMNESGIYHVVGDQAITPYDALCMIARTMGVSETLVKPTTYAVYFEGRAPRPQFANLLNQKAIQIGAHLSTFEQGLAIIRNHLQ